MTKFDQQTNIKSLPIKFNYPIKDAIEIISKTAVEYATNNPVTSLKKIYFISNQEDVVNNWELVLLYIANVYKIKSEAKGRNINRTNERWYWKDDEGKTKILYSS